MLICTIDARRLRGFTLLEMLAVLLLIGLTLGVGLRGSARTDQALTDAMRDLRTSTVQAVQEAVLGGTLLGLDFYVEEGSAQWRYRWLQSDQGQWQPFNPEDTGLFVPRQFAADWRASLQVQGQTIQPEGKATLNESEPSYGSPVVFAPEILVLPSREVTPFTLLVQDAQGQSRLTVDALGGVQLDEGAGPD